MLKKDKVYYDNLNFFFDRDSNLNIIFSFNFLELLRDTNQKIEEDYLKLFKDDYQIKVYLMRQEEFGVFSESFESLEKINLFPDLNVDTYFCKKNIKKFKGKYKIFVRINFSSKELDYINLKLSPDLKPEIFNSLKRTKLNYEENISDYVRKGFFPDNHYEFYFDEIDCTSTNYFISNLYPIYEKNISYSSLENFVNDNQQKREKIDISKNDYFYLNTNVFIENDEINYLDYNFSNETGNINNYDRLMLKIFNGEQGRKSIVRSSLQNLSIKQNNRKNKNREIFSYDKISGNFQSDVCENNLFSNLVEGREIKKSDFVFFAFLLDKNSGLNSEIFRNRINISANILDLKSDYKIYYLKSLNSESMTQNWELLTKRVGNNLLQGTYLCKVSTEKKYISDCLMENYFLLIR